MGQHAAHENHDGDNNTEDQHVDEQDDEESTHQLLWQLQIEPSLIALRAPGPASITCEETDSQTIPPHQTPAQPTATDLMVDDLVMPTIPAEHNPMVTSTDSKPHESSSVDQPTPVSPPWGAYTQEITPVELWLAPIPRTHPQYLHRQFSICDAPMATLDPTALLTCHNCNEWLKDCEPLLGRDLTNNPGTREGGDDEQEFQFLGIPIAGENEGDSDEDWYSDDSTQDEHKDLHTNHCTTASINVTASDSLAFQVGPTQDGRVMIRTHKPIPCPSNPYQLLDEEPLFHPQSYKTLVTWSDTCAVEFRRHLPYITYPAVINAQRLAHPWKIRRQEENRQRKHQHDTMIDLWMTYIHDPTQVSPPQHRCCWWPTSTDPNIRAPLTQPDLLRQNMNHIEQPSLQPRIQYLSHRNGRRTATIRSADEPTPCVLPSADPYSPTTTSDPLSNQAAHPTLPSRIIPGTPDPESPRTAPPRHPTYTAMVRRQYLGILVRRRYHRRLLAHRLNNTQ